MNALFSTLSRYPRPPALAAGSLLHRRPPGARQRHGRAPLRLRKPPIAEGRMEGES
jgi:hypothetical protein